MQERMSVYFEMNEGIQSLSFIKLNQIIHRFSNMYGEMSKNK